MKGITMCADCAYYNIKTHKCTLGCTGEPCIENGDDVRFFTDCPLPNVVEVRHGKWHPVRGVYDLTKWVCCLCGHYVPNGLDRNYCPNCGAKMDGGADNGNG